LATIHLHLQALAVFPFEKTDERLEFYAISFSGK
jgi:hypothetical protein